MEQGDTAGKDNNQTHPFVNLPVLQLNESGTDGRDVALLIGERHSPRPFWIFQFRVGVDPSVAHAPVQTVHDHRQLHWNRQSHMSDLVPQTVLDDS